MNFDLDQALRSFKPHGKTQKLTRRRDADLIWVHDIPPTGSPLLLDTSVYIDVLSGRSPPGLDALIRLRICHHSSVCLSELTHAFGRLNPAHPSTETSLRLLRATISDIPSHRLSAPDSAIWGAAGILAGILFRLGDFAPESKGKCLNDALIYLQARKMGCVAVTGNLVDFDYLNQIVPDGRVIFYRRSV